MTNDRCMSFTACWRGVRGQTTHIVGSHSRLVRDNEQTADTVTVETVLPKRQIRVVHGLGQPTGWVGLGWIGLGRDFLIFGGLGWVVGPKRQKHKN